MIYRESFVENLKREHLDRPNASSGVFEATRTLLNGLPRVEYEDDQWYIVLSDESKEEDCVPQTIVLPGGEWIDNFYRFTVWYKKATHSADTDIQCLFTVYIADTTTVVRNFSKGAYVGYPEDRALGEGYAETRQMTVDEIVAFQNDIAQLEALLKK